MEWRVNECPELTAKIDACAHLWERLPDGLVHCTGHCNATLSGELAKKPPRYGMDWSKAVLVGLFPKAKDT
jgi:hypothetical protein